jgi:hypothetical protein
MKWANVLIAFSIVGAARFAVAAPVITNLIDTGTLQKTTYASPPSNSSDGITSPYGSSLLNITPVVNGSNTSYKVTLSPSSGFLASANNLAGGKTAIFGGTLSFDITFDTAVNLTADVLESGVYSVTGASSRVSVNGANPGSGVTITQLDDLLMPEQLTTSFLTGSTVVPNPTNPGSVLPAGSGSWSLAGQVTGFSKQYQTYHVVIDDDVLAESLADPNAGFAAVSAKNFTVTFSFAPGAGGGVPEPASVGVVLAGCAALILRRRRQPVNPSTSNH